MPGSFNNRKALIFTSVKTIDAVALPNEATVESVEKLTSNKASKAEMVRPRVLALTAS